MQKTMEMSMGDNPVTYVPVKAYNDYISAHIVKGVLEEAGIDSWLKDENTLSVNPMLAQALDGIKIMVSSADAERALEIIRVSENEARKANPCPRCGSLNIEYVTTPRKASNWIGFLFGLFLTNYALSPDKVYHCFQCGFEFPPVEIPES